MKTVKNESLKYTEYGFLEDILNQQNVLIAGSTGSGKSVLIRGIVCEIMTHAPSEYSCVLIDPKKVDLRRFRNIPHCIRYASEVDDIYTALLDCHSEMMRRYDVAKDNGSYSYDGQAIYIIVEEFADLIMHPTYGKKIVDLLQSIGQLCRASSIHLILATQAPSRQVIKAEIALNMTAQIALRCRSAIESRQIIGEVGAENLPKYGKCLYYTPNFGRVVSVDVPMMEEPYILHLMEYWSMFQFDE